VFFLVVGVGVAVLLFQVLSAAGLEFVPAALISLLPLAGLTVFIHFLVNAKPHSFAFDLLIGALWRLKVNLYLSGFLDRPPQFWVKEPCPPHPVRFNSKGNEVA
jgi:hypothetical protein